MFIALPLLSCVFIMFCLSARGCDYRQAFLGAAVCFGLLLTTATELLSLFSAITCFSLAAFWGGVTLLGLLCLSLVWSRQIVRKPRFDNLGLLAGIGTVLAVTLLIALVSPPNNVDSMTYHMARVVHWIQNKSVAHYPTHITRQLYSAPWAEYAIMHLQILSVGDRFANLVQWFAMCGSIVAASLIVREFGASGRIQAFASVITATIPMGILQASSTQNDLVVAFWLACFVYFGMLLSRTPAMPAALACGASLGLAFLTKGTAYIFAAPFLAWLFLAGLKKNGYTFLKPLMVISVIAVTLNSGHYWRNYALWGNPLATDDGKLTNDRITFQVTVSNLTRNVASHTWTPFESVSLLQFQGVALVHELLGTNINDPATSLTETFAPGRMSRDEDYAGNGLHMLLALLSIGVLTARRSSVPRPQFYYALSLCGGFLLFCVLLKWQPWGTRLQLPLFVLAAPLIAATMPLDRRRWAVPAVAAFMLFCSVPWLFANQTRPLWGDQSILRADRESLYFVKRPELESYYAHAVEQFASRGSCNTIGILSSSGNTYEYPFWVLLNRGTETMPRVEHVNVGNISGSIARKNFNPCFIFEIL